MIRVETFDSALLGRKRKLRVYTPPGLAPDGVAPLLIQQDGQLAFTDRDDDLPFGSWRLDAWIARLAAGGTIRPPVVVGVDNSPARMKEYFPVTEEFATYERFLHEEVLPWARTNLPVSPDGPVALMGSSMGGLVSFALAMNRPDVFSAAACLSPWFEYENNRTIHEYLRPMTSKPAVRLYMDSGIQDWRDLDDGHRGMRLARLELLRLGFEEGRDFDWMVDTWFPTEADLEDSVVKEDKRGQARTNQHNEFQWSRRLARPLMFLFGPGEGASSG